MEILQEKISNKHQDSLFYDGYIAQIGKYILIATGDIEISEITGEYPKRVFARGKRYIDEIDFDDDQDLEKKMSSGKYEYNHNNWFEVIDDTGECVIGDVVYDYDDGIELLKGYHKEKIYN